LSLTVQYELIFELKMAGKVINSRNGSNLTVVVVV
jgi:hypothetical protein